jgi:hypothetical protein
MADQISIQLAETMVAAGSAVSATVNFRTRSTAAASTPSSIRYRVDCLTNRREVIADTSVSAASSVTITVPGPNNGTIDPAQEFEVRQLTVTADYGLSTQCKAAVTWRVRNIRAFPFPHEFDNEEQIEPYYPITDAEETAGLDDDDLAHQYDNLPIIDLRRYGLSEDATAAVNSAAIEAAKDVANALDGGILQAPPGTFQVAGNVIDVNSVIIRGVGRGTVWRYDGSGVCFDFDRGASSSEFCGVLDCQFYSANSNNKTAIRVDDARTFWARNILIAQTSWLGSGSIGINVRGRELVYLRELQLLCARPVVYGVNPNFATLHTDFFVLEDGILGSTETTGAAIEFEDGVNISNIVISRIAMVLGKWGIKWVDTSSTIDSYAVKIVDCRTEQATDATGYSIELNTTAQDIKQVLIEKFYSDPGRNGLKLREFEDCAVKNSSFTGGTGVTNIDATFQSASLLRLENTFVQLLSTATLTNGLFVRGSAHNSAFSLLPMNAEYRYDEGAVISQKPSLTYNSVREWHYAGSLGDDVVLNLPVSDVNGVTLAHVKVSAVGATQHEGGEITFSQRGIQSLGGTTNFILSNTDANLCVYDGGADDLVVRNRLGETVVVLIDAFWTTL